MKMEFLTEYLRLIFISAIICLPTGIIFFILLKRDLIKQTDNAKKIRLLKFSKSLIVLSVIIIPIYILTTPLNLNFHHKRLYENKADYIKSAIAAMKNKGSDSFKYKCASASHDYLYKKYGNKIYYEDFISDSIDENNILLITIRILNPNLSDSAKQDMCNKAKMKLKEK